MKIFGGVSASRIVIALSARWLINLELACVPSPSILYGDMVITGDLVLLTLFDVRVAGAGLVSGRINIGKTRLIAGTAPGVILRFIHWCVRVSFIKFLLAVGSRAFMIAGALEILVIGTMSSVSRCVVTSQMLLSTLCLLAMGGFGMAFIALPNDLMSVRPLFVLAAMPVDTSNSLVSAFKCALLLRLGAWQCWGNSLTDPEILYVHVSGT